MKGQEMKDSDFLDREYYVRETKYPNNEYMNTRGDRGDFRPCLRLDGIEYFLHDHPKLSSPVWRELEDYGTEDGHGLKMHYTSTRIKAEKALVKAYKSDLDDHNRWFMNQKEYVYHAQDFSKYEILGNNSSSTP